MDMGPALIPFVLGSWGVILYSCVIYLSGTGHKRKGRWVWGSGQAPAQNLKADFELTR